MKILAAAALIVACCFSWAPTTVEGEPSVAEPAAPDRAAPTQAASPSRFQGSEVGRQEAGARLPINNAHHQSRIRHSCDSEGECRRIAYSLGRVVRKLRRANNHRLQLGATGVARGLLCIHSFEGSWTDGGAPFWGGLQMDASFQRTYGGPFVAALGTADNWPPFLQVAVAMRAYYSGRGFGPWPNTRRMCGL